MIQNFRLSFIDIQGKKFQGSTSKCNIFITMTTTVNPVLLSCHLLLVSCHPTMQWGNYIYAETFPSPFPRYCNIRSVSFAASLPKHISTTSFVVVLDVYGNSKAFSSNLMSVFSHNVVSTTSPMLFRSGLSTIISIYSFLKLFRLISSSLSFPSAR